MRRPGVNARSTAAGARADDWDVIIIGAGLGGSFAALRLAERGFTSWYWSLVT
jgi:glycerol-3-phosphate dehydrogenase